MSRLYARMLRTLLQIHRAQRPYIRGNPASASAYALVPADLYSQPGEHVIHVRRGTFESNCLHFIVEP